MAFPLEVLTGGISALAGAGLKMWGVSQQYRMEREMLMLNISKEKMKWIADARKITDKKFAWTRRTIALSIILSVIVLPKLVALFFPEIPVTVGYTEMKAGTTFLFFSKEGVDAFQWSSFQGLVLTPLDTFLATSVAGFYLGAATVGKR